MLPGLTANTTGWSPSDEEDSNKIKVDPGMFPNLRWMDKGLNEPTVDDMEEKANAVRFKKVINLIDVQLRTFDLGDPKQVEDYRKTYAELYKGMSAGHTVVKQFEKVFINDKSNPRWVVHMEWNEYELKTEDLMDKHTKGKDDGESSKEEQTASN